MVLRMLFFVQESGEVCGSAFSEATWPGEVGVGGDLLKAKSP